MLIALRRAGFAAVIAAVTTSASQTMATELRVHPNTMIAQAATPAGPQQGAQPEADMMPGNMRQGMMGDMMQPGMGGTMPMMPMRGHVMKIMFAIADTDGDGALSFEEVMAIHKRIFDKVDSNSDGKVTLAEVQAFMRE